MYGIVAPQADRLEHDNQQCEPHGELRKQIVKRSGEGKVQTVNEECAVHKLRPRLTGPGFELSSLSAMRHKLLVSSQAIASNSDPFFCAPIPRGVSPGGARHHRSGAFHLQSRE